MAFVLNSPAFAEGDTIPKDYTCNGTDESPPLSWYNAPAGTHSFALILHDMDASGSDFMHWLLWDIPRDAGELPRDADAAFADRTGINDFGERGYSGPCLHTGQEAHRYRFVLYALDEETLAISTSAHRAEVEAAILGHVLAQAQLTGCYAGP
jgi:hypothetical protein